MEYFANLGDGLFWFLVLLTPLVFVHEMGHFVVARWCGVRVEIFSIGFGPEIFGWTDRRNTRWKFAAIPLGGYIKMFGEHSLGPGDDGKTRELTNAEKAVSIEHKSLLQRAAVVAAGPGANYLFAILILAGMFATIGQSTAPPQIGEVADGTPAAAAGLQDGDVVVSIDGDSIDTFAELIRIVRLSPDQDIEIVVRRGDQDVILEATTAGVDVEASGGLTMREGKLGILSFLPAIVGKVVPDSPAAGAGLQPGDRFIRAEGSKINNFRDLQGLVSASAGRSLAITILRGDEELVVDVVPAPHERETEDGGTETIGLIGVQSAVGGKMVRLGPFAALWEGTVLALDMNWRILQSIGQLFAGERDTKELGGPILIAQTAQDVSDLGIVQFLSFMAIFSINLGLINLFPVPVLDGGHLLFYAIEAIRGRPLSERVQEYSLRIGLALLVSLMIFVIFNDLLYRVL